ncbi:hypothetical protein CHS0354_036406 [Potamilus streckersoni]|uniref:Uncharacterized protein n=1 Tax=Potamilus streckersoni TaxID=2493646 RepID=A0AAE0SXH5_9BIVA|nr:hypothetical protein CHS0354_036406 [Potamilus streckersoni]
MSANLVNLNEIDAIKGTISVVMFFEVTWVDERLKWDPIKYDNISYLLLPSDDLWVPPLFLTNPTERITSLAGKNVKVTLFPDGKIKYLPGEVIGASCFINITMFPFDTQECFIQFIPWGYTVADIETIADPIPVGTEYFSQNGEWEYIRSTNVHGCHSTLPFVSFRLYFKRRHQYFVINLVAPIVIVDVLNIMVFLLPCECEERISFSITVLLSYVVFLTMFSNFIPRNALAMSFMSYYLFHVLVGSFMITVANIVSIRVCKAKSSIPTWMKCIFCRHSRKRIAASAIDPKNDTVDFKMETWKYKNDNYCNNSVGDEVTWMTISSVLDKIFIFLCVIYNELCFEVQKAELRVRRDNLMVQEGRFERRAKIS